LADTARILFALGLPFLTGALFVCAFWQSRSPGFRLAVAGLAFPLGMVGVMTGYLLLDRAGVGLQFSWNVAVQAVLAAGCSLLAWRRWRGHAPASPRVPGDSWTELPNWGKALVVALVTWLGIRWAGMVVEVMHRPLFPWDAWYAYGMQARVWFFAQRLDVFANGPAWFASEQPAWAAGGVRHPPGIGLMQLWMVQSLDRWDDALMNLPWPLAWASLLAGLSGVLRLAGVGIVLATIAVWLVGAIPVLAIQTVLTGYGDLWIAVFLFIAVAIGFMAGCERRVGLLMPFFAAVAGLLLIKEVGLFWCVVLLFGLATAWFPVSRVVLAALAVGVITVVAAWWTDSAVTIGILGNYGFDDGRVVAPGYTDMWGALFRHLFVLPNWHLFWYLAIAVLPMMVRAARSSHAARGIVAVGLCGVLALTAVFAFSDLAEAVIDGTSVNRLYLHVVPVLGLGMALGVDHWLRRAR